MTEGTPQQPQPTAAELMELLSKLKSTYELPLSVLSKEKGLSDEQAILFIMRFLEDIEA